MLKGFGLCNPNYTYTLCKFGFPNPEYISLVILAFKCTSLTYIIIATHNENLDNTHILFFVKKKNIYYLKT